MPMARRYHQQVRRFGLPSMSVVDKISLSPWQKLIKYKRFPFKFVVHVLLVVLITVQMVLFSSRREIYLYSSGNTIINRFLPDGFEEPMESGTGYSTFYFYDTKEIVQFVRSTVKTYYNFVNDSIDYVSYHRPGASEEAHDNYEYCDTNSMFPDIDVFEDDDDDDEDCVAKGFVRSASLKAKTNNNSSSTEVATTKSSPNGVGDSNSIKPVVMRAAYYKNINFKNVDVSKPLDKSIREVKYELTKRNPIGPFHPNVTADVQDYFHKLINFELKFRFNTFYIQKSYPECHHWDITLQFDFTTRGGRVPLYGSYDIGLCDNSQQATSFEQFISTPVMWVSISVMSLGFVSFILIAKAMWSTYRTIKKVDRDKSLYYSSNSATRREDEEESKSLLKKEDEQDKEELKKTTSQYKILLEGFQKADIPQQAKKQKKYKELSLWDKLSFFNPWHPITLISSVFAILSSVMTIANTTYRFYSLNPTNIALGLSAILAWTNLVQYFAHAPKFYILITALRRGLPNVVRFIVGALPIMIGFAMCGTILFGSYSKYFRNIGVSFVTLFSLANGDVIHDTFDMTYGQNTLIAMISRLYVVSYVVLFTYSVINIFILIMEDAFYDVKGGGILEKLKISAAEKRKNAKSNTTLVIGGSGTKQKTELLEVDEESDDLLSQWPKVEESQADLNSEFAEIDESMMEVPNKEQKETMSKLYESLEQAKKESSNEKQLELLSSIEQLIAKMNTQ